MKSNKEIKHFVTGNLVKMGAKNRRKVFTGVISTWSQRSIRAPELASSRGVFSVLNGVIATFSILG